MTVVDANTFTVQSKDRAANGERQPDIPEITIKRQQVAKAEPNPKAPAKPPRRVLP